MFLRRVDHAKQSRTLLVDVLSDSHKKCVDETDSYDLLVNELVQDNKLSLIVISNGTVWLFKNTLLLQKHERTP